ncbi:LacI family DNA-binding transcriptional regulator [Dactylosporangium sp. AC04546]|uniref:LacI family DNA-binding transcriptional regulator n=1 Tax=Dactylosporangium sp. AC04546 TaxID=2862460 RepID=UPI001EDFF87B|nr:LacI family DNA-binding transcriptional regulator [Dactylosporangium sp. AC04546]WVK81885.1 LacI family DNA-binding transcriptional regulator [Dactylosporangium sp. AC04546]
MRVGMVGRRITQRDIARMTGVSQATVSLVLNDRADSGVRIAPETRQRVLDAIRATGYVADVVGRRLADRSNRILGVFTYEPVFPSAAADFYHPFLIGIEERAEELGCDLLLFTSTPVVDGRRRLFEGDNRMRLADGCILLGRSIDRIELERLVAEGHPFVSVGRRDGDNVPYVGADYATAVGALVRKAVAMGHHRLAYVGTGGPAESHADRLKGFAEACLSTGADGVHHTRLDQAVRGDFTAILLEEPADAGEAIRALEHHGTPEVSVVALGEPTRRTTTPAPRELTRFRTPRREMGWQAADDLTALVNGAPARQRLLPCELVDGVTLSAVHH